jgi:hypothetical protein
MDINEIKAKNAYYERLVKAANEDKRFFEEILFTDVELSNKLTISGLKNVSHEKQGKLIDSIVKLKETCVALNVNATLIFQ